MSAPLLSIIVTAHNEESSIMKCVNSIIDQSFEQLELIVIDDSSQDSTLDILRGKWGHSENVQIHANSKNLGLGQTRNKGMEIARGQYLMFVDGDDWLYDNALHELKILLGTSPDLLIINHNLCYANAQCVAANQRALLQNHPGEDAIAQKSRLLRVFHTAWNKVYKRTFLLAHRLRFPTGSYEDLVFSYSAILLADDIKTHCGALYNYRQHPDTVPGRPNNKSSRVDHNIVFVRYKVLFEFLKLHSFLSTYGSILYTKMLNQYSAILCERVRGGIRNKRAFFKIAHIDAHRYRLTEDYYFSIKDRINIILFRNGQLYTLLLLNAIYTKYKQLSSLQIFKH